MIIQSYKTMLVLILFVRDNDCPELVSGGHNSMKDNTVSKLL